MRAKLFDQRRNHDAYAAAPSRKAAFEAWGSDRDLCGRGLAEQVTDENLTRRAFVSRAIRSSRFACGSAGLDACRSRPRAMRYGLSEVAPGGAMSAIFARSSTASAPLPTAATAYGTSRRRFRTCLSGIGRHRFSPGAVGELWPAPCPVVGHASYPAGPMKQPRCCLEARASG